MKIDLNKWTVISKPRVAAKKQSSFAIRVTLQRNAKATYLVFTISEKAAKDSHIAIWDRVSVALSTDGKYVTLFKTVDGTHKVTCTKAKDKQGECRRGHIKVTVRDMDILNAFGFADQTAPSELIHKEIGDGFITCYAERKIKQFFEHVFAKENQSEKVSV